MSGNPNVEEFQRTLEEAGNQISREIQEAGRLKSDPSASVDNRERIVFESLEKARISYQKKEYARAFIEWERACSAMGDGEAFRAKVRALKASHENLSKVTRELNELREALTQRTAASPADAKFIDQAQDTMNGQVKNVYSHLSQELRSPQRSPRSLSFWWPVLLAVGITAGGFAFLNGYHLWLQNNTATAPAPVSADAGRPSQTPVDATFLEAQRNAMIGENEKQLTDLKAAHETAISDLKRAHAEAARNDRERIVQLETKLNEAVAESSDRERQIKALMDDNLNKDAVIASLN